MAHIGWFFLLDDDLDALDAQVRSQAPGARWWTSSGQIEEHPSLRAATVAARQVWIADGAPGPDRPALLLTASLLRGEVLIGGNLGHAVAAADRSDEFEQLRLGCTSALHAIARPRVVTSSGERAGRYGIGPAAAEWWGSGDGRVLRDESIPTLTYAVEG